MVLKSFPEDYFWLSPSEFEILKSRQKYESISYMVKKNFLLFQSSETNYYAFYFRQNIIHSDQKAIKN